MSKTTEKKSNEDVTREAVADLHRLHFEMFTNWLVAWVHNPQVDPELKRKVAYDKDTAFATWKTNEPGFMSSLEKTDSPTNQKSNPTKA